MRNVIYKISKIIKKIDCLNEKLILTVLIPIAWKDLKKNNFQ